VSKIPSEDQQPLPSSSSISSTIEPYDVFYDLLTNNPISSPSKSVISELSNESSFPDAAAARPAPKLKAANQHMTILVIQEIDKLSSPLLQKLLDLTCRCDKSNLLIVATGNRIDYFDKKITHPRHQKVAVVGFTAYSTEFLQSLIQQRAKPLFQEVAMKLTAIRFCKGDVRYLFSGAKAALINAVTDIQKKDSDWRNKPVREIVNASHVPDLNKKDKDCHVNILDNLPADNRIFVVAATLEKQNQHTSFSAVQALQFYNNYALTHSPLQPLDDIFNVLATLEGNNLLRTVKEHKNRNLTRYQLKISNEVIHSLVNLTSRQKEELEHYYAADGLTQDC